MILNLHNCFRLSTIGWMHQMISWNRYPKLCKCFIMPAWCKFFNIFEILKNYSVYHFFRIDDIEDNSILRRGSPATHSIYGVTRTTNTANYVYFLALEKTLALNHPQATLVFTGECGSCKFQNKYFKEYFESMLFLQQNSTLVLIDISSSR